MRSRLLLILLVTVATSSAWNVGQSGHSSPRCSQSILRRRQSTTFRESSQVNYEEAGSEASDNFLQEFERQLFSQRWTASSSNFWNSADNLDQTTKVSETSSPASSRELSPFYRHDQRDTSSLPITDPVGLARLLEQRFQARRANQLDRVSEIDLALKQQHQVRVYDHPPIWTRLVKDPPRAFLRRKRQRRIDALKRLYGPTGHPYRQVGQTTKGDSPDYQGLVDPLAMDACPLTMIEIHDLLSRRTQCLMEGRYEEADAVQFELSIHGVRLHEEWNQWTMDQHHVFVQEHGYSSQTDHRDHSSGSGERSFPEQERQNSIEKEPLVSEGSPPDRTLQRVQQLLHFHRDALARGEHECASWIALELYRTYRVTIDISEDSRKDHPSLLNAETTDKTLLATALQHQEKTAVSQRVRLFPPISLRAVEKIYESSTVYQLSTKSLPLKVPGALSRIERMIKDRIHKREEAKYLEADAIRRELWRTYNVGVNDRLQQFSVGGVFDE